MKRALLMPMLAATLVMGACEEDGDPTTVGGAQAQVRFVNAVSGATGPIAFTSNGTMVGSAQVFGVPSTTCTSVPAGSRTLAFGLANATGTGISGTAFSTSTQNFVGGRNYTVIASGSSSNPTFTVLDNSFTGSLGSSQTAVRFVNLVPSSGGTATNVDVFTGQSTTAASSGLTFGSASTFTTVASGVNNFTFRSAGGTTALVNAGQLVLQPGSVNTVAITPNPTGGYQLVNITACA